MQKANEMSGLLASEDKPGHVIGFADPVFGGKSKDCICFLECFSEVSSFQTYPMNKKQLCNLSKKSKCGS